MKTRANRGGCMEGPEVSGRRPHGALSWDRRWSILGAMEVAGRLGRQEHNSLSPWLLYVNRSRCSWGDLETWPKQRAAGASSGRDEKNRASWGKSGVLLWTQAEGALGQQPHPQACTQEAGRGRSGLSWMRGGGGPRQGTHAMSGCAPAPTHVCGHTQQAQQGGRLGPPSRPRVCLGLEISVWV